MKYYNRKSGAGEGEGVKRSSCHLGTAISNRSPGVPLQMQAKTQLGERNGLSISQISHSSQKF